MEKNETNYRMKRRKRKYFSRYEKKEMIKEKERIR